ncbi:hypothetical protein DIPPA_16787 [Diplonema papillatum]|nr:hypothetical protein DIPPA_16787 [Diplonema papillatum]
MRSISPFDRPLTPQGIQGSDEPNWASAEKGCRVVDASSAGAAAVLTVSGGWQVAGDGGEPRFLLVKLPPLPAGAAIRFIGWQASSRGPCPPDHAEIFTGPSADPATHRRLLRCKVLPGTGVQLWEKRVPPSHGYLRAAFPPGPAAAGGAPSFVVERLHLYARAPVLAPAEAPAAKQTEAGATSPAGSGSRAGSSSSSTSCSTSITGGPAAEAEAEAEPAKAKHGEEGTPRATLRAPFSHSSPSHRRRRCAAEDGGEEFSFGRGGDGGITPIYGLAAAARRSHDRRSVERSLPFRPRLRSASRSIDTSRLAEALQGLNQEVLKLHSVRHPASPPPAHALSPFLPRQFDHLATPPPPARTPDRRLCAASSVPGNPQPAAAGRSEPSPPPAAACAAGRPPSPSGGASRPGSPPVAVVGRVASGGVPAALQPCAPGGRGVATRARGRSHPVHTAQECGVEVPPGAAPHHPATEPQRRREGCGSTEELAPPPSLEQSGCGRCCCCCCCCAREGWDAQYRRHDERLARCEDQIERAVSLLRQLRSEPSPPRQHRQTAAAHHDLSAATTAGSTLNLVDFPSGDNVQQAVVAWVKPALQRWAKAVEKKITRSLNQKVDGSFERITKNSVDRRVSELLTKLHVGAEGAPAPVTAWLSDAKAAEKSAPPAPLKDVSHLLSPPDAAAGKYRQPLRARGSKCGMSAFVDTTAKAGVAPLAGLKVSTPAQVVDSLTAIHRKWSGLQADSPAGAGGGEQEGGSPSVSPIPHHPPAGAGLGPDQPGCKKLRNRVASGSASSSCSVDSEGKPNTTQPLTEPASPPSELSPLPRHPHAAFHAHTARRPPSLSSTPTSEASPNIAQTKPRFADPLKALHPNQFSSLGGGSDHAFPTLARTSCHVTVAASTTRRTLAGM